MINKVLWLCNIVLPDFSDDYNIKRTVYGGWMTGLYHELKVHTKYKFVFCFPIRNKDKLINGKKNEDVYYSFLDKDEDEVNPDNIRFFEKVLKEKKPDIIHIWGTEYLHSKEMIIACENVGCLDNAVVYIQGLVSVYALKYCSGLPHEILSEKDVNHNSILIGKNQFVRKGQSEIDVIKKCKHVMGRTDWDHAHALAINKNVQYHHQGEVLRESFYKNAGTWNIDEIEPYSIFVSQASYPVKGFHYVLSALKRIVVEYPETKVYVAGKKVLDEETLYSFYLMSLFDDIESHVVFLGNQSPLEMISNYKKASLFLSASTIENSSNSICEAMMIGTPVVASFVGGNGSLIKNHETGFVYPEDDLEMMIYYIKTIFDRNVNLSLMSEKETLFALDYNSKDKAVENLINCYDEIQEGLERNV